MQVLEHEQGDQGGPELNLQGVGAGADEGLDAQVLLQRLEKEFNLPALAIDGGDGGGGKVGMVLRNTKVRCWAWSQTSMRRRNRSRSALRQLVKEEDDLVALDETALEDRTALQVFNRTTKCFRAGLVMCKSLIPDPLQLEERFTSTIRPSAARATCSLALAPEDGCP